MDPSNINTISIHFERYKKSGISSQARRILFIPLFCLYWFKNIFQIMERHKEKRKSLCYLHPNVANINENSAKCQQKSRNIEMWTARVRGASINSIILNKSLKWKLINKIKWHSQQWKAMLISLTKWHGIMKSNEKATTKQLNGAEQKWKAMRRKQIFWRQ